jgi:hypothetical protein
LNAVLDLGIRLFYEPGRVEPLVDVVAHAGHLALTVAVELLFDPRCLLFKEPCTRYTARKESEALGLLSYEFLWSHKGFNLFHTEKQR